MQGWVEVHIHCSLNITKYLSWKVITSVWHICLCIGAFPMLTLMLMGILLMHKLLYLRNQCNSHQKLIAIWRSEAWFGLGGKSDAL